MPKAILSVYDKTGLVDFARGLDARGFTLIASGGTAALLAQHGLAVTEVADYTGSPEILGGRVKTLHPAIHGGILARETEEDRADLTRLGWDYLDLVVVNLYPFEETINKPDATLSDAVENIDIGGVTLIRAAAKNFARTLLVCDPADYDAVLHNLDNGTLDEEKRRALAVKGFGMTAKYDALIAAYLADEAATPLHLYKERQLRYGENPHQTAELFTFKPGAAPLGGEVLQGKELSYNNLLDLDAAWRAVLGFARPCAVIVKHLSPCGIACADTLVEAWHKAFACDTISPFGGIFAFNRELDLATVEAIGGMFVECIIAPAFTEEALAKLAVKKNCRVLRMTTTAITPPYEYRSVIGGLVRQSLDFGDPAGTTWMVTSKKQPTEAQLRDLKFAMCACQHVKSNAIVFAKDEATVGIGGGQPNRVDSVRIAINRAAENAHGAVMASDAFFPFPDSVEAAIQAGITAIVHPGGSVRDAESLAVADAAGIVMMTSAVRHFRH